MHDTRKWSVTSSLWGTISISVRSIPCDIIKSSVWLKRCVGPVTFCLTPKEFIRSVNASPNASFVLSTWMLKSPTISALSTLTNRSERKSANSFRKSVYCPGGLYTVARARDRQIYFLIWQFNIEHKYFEWVKPVSCFLSNIEKSIYYYETAATTSLTRLVLITVAWWSRFI